MSYDQLLFLALQNCLAKLVHIATDTKVPDTHVLNREVSITRHPVSI